MNIITNLSKGGSYLPCQADSDLEFDYEGAEGCRVIINGDTAFTLYAVNGYCALSDFNTLLRDLVEGEGVMTVTIEVEDIETGATDSLEFTLVECSVDFSSADAKRIMEGNAFATVAKEKSTIMTAKESLYTTSTGTAAVSLVWLKEDGTISTTEEKVEPKQIANRHFRTLDVSPANFSAPEPEAKLAGYTVRCGSGRMHYDVLHSNHFAPVVFTFRNCFNLPETLVFTGDQTVETKVERGNAYVNGRYLNFKMTPTRSVQVNSGALLRDEARLLEDMVCSRSVKVTNYVDGCADLAVTITDSELKMSGNDQSLLTATVTYRHQSKMLRQRPSAYAEKTFTEQFDTSFE